MQATTTIAPLKQSCLRRDYGAKGFLHTTENSWNSTAASRSEGAEVPSHVIPIVHLRFEILPSKVVQMIPILGRDPNANNIINEPSIKQ